MLTTYTVENGHIAVRENTRDPDLLRRAVWIDMLQPSLEEEHAVRDALAIEISTREEMQEIESSSRLYRKARPSFSPPISSTASIQANSARRRSPSCSAAIPSSRCAMPRPRPSGLRRALLKSPSLLASGDGDAAPVRADRGSPGRYPGAHRCRYGPREPRRLPPRQGRRRHGCAKAT